MRRSFSNLKDSDLLRIHSNAETTRRILDDRYRTEGAVEIGEAQAASDIIEQGLVARAVARLRMLWGGEGSHKTLRMTSIRLNPKEVDAAFGDSLRERRRV